MTTKLNAYSHLKGNPVECILDEGRKWSANGKNRASGFVAEIDFYVGITIKCLDTQKDLVCFEQSR